MESVAWLRWLGFLCPSKPWDRKILSECLTCLMYVSDFSHICIKYLMIVSKVLLGLNYSQNFTVTQASRINKYTVSSLTIWIMHSLISNAFYIINNTSHLLSYSTSSNTVLIFLFFQLIWSQTCYRASPLWKFRNYRQALWDAILSYGILVQADQQVAWDITLHAIRKRYKSLSSKGVVCKFALNANVCMLKP